MSENKEVIKLVNKYGDLVGLYPYEWSKGFLTCINLKEIRELLESLRFLRPSRLRVRTASLRQQTQTALHFFLSLSQRRFPGTQARGSFLA